MIRKQRSVKRHITAKKVNMGGHLLDQPLPHQFIESIDPFLLIHHWAEVLPVDRRPQELGVPPHPHRGFSPVTFIFEGDVQHRDSLGNNSIVKSGGTQWINAGRGITHSERPSKELAEKGGMQELIQFWINTPSSLKMSAPEYVALQKNETPTYIEDHYSIAVIAGEQYGIKGPIQGQIPMLLLRGEVSGEAEIEHEIPKSYNALIYVLNGSFHMDGRIVDDRQMVWLENNGDGFKFKCHEEGRYILLAGAPINEKVTQYGPFVMNTQTQIMQALRDAQMGKMGILIEEF
jgi:redox-sensitive bicupin YhaK (pirin superfamily)